MSLVKNTDALLPQTQCKECGYDGCMPYAERIANHQDSIDKCPPGGTETLIAIADLLSINPRPYLAESEKNHRKPQVAAIREDECIGCTKCIQACPVDAIIGSAKKMHAILESECTGCNLCVEPCPVDCIDMIDIPQPLFDKDNARNRYNNKKVREMRIEQEKKHHYLKARKLSTDSDDKKAKQDYIFQALARVKKKHK
jgi:H+/Na+-translocating ferredoxin:NAD+ oxidoreductase subunit B